MWQSMFHLGVHLGLLLIATTQAARQDVRLSVDQPLNDISEQYVSFLIKPEELYAVLDGPKRKEITRMAALLGPAYVKLSGDYFFATKTKNRARSATMIIWEGFNRWTSAVNWKMIIAVPYTPKDWDAMHALYILDASYKIGITDCIWQFGLDFAATSASEYINDLNTFKLMVEDFQPYVTDWRVIGADISAGSSLEETKRYLKASRNINAAFGWTQAPNMLTAFSMGNYIYEQDPALQALLSQTKPVWLTLSMRDKRTRRTRKISKSILSNEADVIEGLRWAQTLGDAAVKGFDVIFSEVSAADWAQPNYSFYITALFKKLMGSRVFPAKLLNKLVPTNKLYTHCANGISGGIAFMAVNTEHSPLKLTVRSNSVSHIGEYWQYTLTTDKQRDVLLNNAKLYLNTTLEPKIKFNDPSSHLELATPSMSISFWVMPTINLEHCQYTEVPLANNQAARSNEMQRTNANYTAVERLVRKIIADASVSRTDSQRRRRFILADEHKLERPRFIGKLIQPLSSLFPKHSMPEKREVAQPVLRSVAQSWLNQTKELTDGMFLRRNIRNAPASAAKSQIDQSKQASKEPIFDLSNFDEEKYFAKMSKNAESTPPNSTTTPSSDVHVKYIETIHGVAVVTTEPHRRRNSTEKSLKTSNGETALFSGAQKNAEEPLAKEPVMKKDKPQAVELERRSHPKMLQSALAQPGSSAAPQTQAREKRALTNEIMDAGFNANMIDKKTALLPLGANVEHRFALPNNVMEIPSTRKSQEADDYNKSSMGTKFVTNLSKLVGVVGNHVHTWFESIIREIDDTDNNETVLK